LKTTPFHEWRAFLDKMTRHAEMERDSGAVLPGLSSDAEGFKKN
jgi:hypothetical protein